VPARADRIDSAEDGSLVISAYKTGQVPTQSRVDKLYAPLLPLAAAIAAEGGFGDLGVRTVRSLRYVGASGRGTAGGEERDAGTLAASELGVLSLAALRELIARFDRPDTPYDAKRRPGSAFRSAYTYDDYAQLARVQEWAEATDGDG
jgi:ATP-dependent helicase/nuclease subunit B